MALAEFLLNRQQDFFIHGESHLSPLKMKEAAAKYREEMGIGSTRERKSWK